MSMREEFLAELENFTTRELEEAVYRIDRQVRRGTFKEATYRRLLINKLKTTHVGNMMMSTQQARSLTSNRGKKLGDNHYKNILE